jgi:hypothetical protein
VTPGVRAGAVAALLAGLVLTACTGAASSTGPATTTPGPTAATATTAAPTATAPQGPSPDGVAARCGSSRWDVKTASDAAARNLDPAAVHDTTISALGAIPRPPSTVGRRPPVETTVYRVHAVLREYRVEADSDVHLVLDDGPSHMIAEIPSPACDAGSAFGTRIAAARAAFDAGHREDSRWTRDGEPVVVTGIGFFDDEHGQTGAAPNAVELHPVLAVTFGP